MTNIGLMYFKGRGVPKDIAKGKDWFEKAAAAGDPRGKQALEELKELAPAAAPK
jgi:TPR repeat protein